jgi:hypothetical protein
MVVVVLVVVVVVVVVVADDMSPRSMAYSEITDGENSFQVCTVGADTFSTQTQTVDKANGPNWRLDEPNNLTLNEYNIMKCYSGPSLMIESSGGLS